MAFAGSSVRLPSISVSGVYFCSILVLGLQACVPTPSMTIRHEVQEVAWDPVKLPTGVEKMPIKVGVYFPAGFSEYIHKQRGIGNSTVELPVGEASRIHFMNVFQALFSQSTIVQDRPPFSSPTTAKEMSAVVGVRIEDFRWTAQHFGPVSAQATYRFTVYSPSGNTIASWTESGASTGKLGFTEDPDKFVGKIMDQAMRVASGRFIGSFQRRPEIQRWLAITDGKPEAPAAAASVAAVVGERQAKTSIPGNKQLTAPEVEKLFVGNTESGTYVFRGRTIAYSEYYRRDGRIKGEDSVFGKYEARYQARQDGCFYLDYPDSQYDGCYFFEHLGGDQYRSTYPDGSSRVVSIRIGDPENLNEGESDESGRMATAAAAAAEVAGSAVYDGSVGIVSSSGQSDSRAGVAKGTAEQNAAVQSGRTIGGLSIEATLFSQHGLERRPYHSTGITSQVLAAHIKIKNNGTETVLVRPNDITLSPRQGARLYPASTIEIVQRVHQGPSTSSSDAVGAAFGIVPGIIASAVESSAQNSEIENAKHHFASTQLVDASLRPGETASGFVYFEALGIDGKFEEAKLRIRLGEATSTESYDVTLPVGKGTTVTENVVLTSIGVTDLTEQSNRGLASGSQSLSTSQDSGILDPALKPEVLRLAIFPFAARHPALGHLYSGQDDLEKFSKSFASGRSDAKLVYSYYQPEIGGSLNMKLNLLWEGVVDKKPVEQELYAQASMIGADIILTFFHAARSFDYSSEAYLVDIYVFDVKSQRTYHSRSDDRGFKQVTARLFDELVSDRERSGVKKFVE